MSSTTVMELPTQAPLYAAIGGRFVIAAATFLLAALITDGRSRLDRLHVSDTDVVVTKAVGSFLGSLAATCNSGVVRQLLVL